MAKPRIYDYPPVWAFEAGVLEYVLARYVPFWDFSHLVPNWIGGVVMALGFLLILWSALWFWRRSTTIEPGKTPKALIVEGPFRISRNPIYLGMAIFLSGFALLLGALSAFAAVAGFVYVISKRFITREEATLRETFGPDAMAYLGKTRRWF